MCITGVRRGKICWCFHISGQLSLKRYRSLIFISLMSAWEVNFILFNSMLKYVINRLMHAFFHIRTVIIPRPISTLGTPNFGVYVWAKLTLLLNKYVIINRLMHALFHIRTVIIPRDRYRSEGFSPKAVDKTVRTRSMILFISENHGINISFRYETHL
jgi:hypothetical protein